MQRLEKEVRIGYGKGKRGNVSVVREHYLRDDIPCKSEACVLCGTLIPPGMQLLGFSSHYVLPDVTALSEFLEVFEHPSILNIILLQTTIAHVRSKVSRRSYSRVTRLLKSPAKQCVVFSNEHNVETFLHQSPEETREQWQRRLVFRAGVWYANHLQASGRTIPIVITTTQPQWYDGFDAGTTEGFLVMGVGDYLACFWPDLGELHSLYESLEASIRATRGEGTKQEYPDYLPDHLIQEGLKKGQFLRGSLHVSRFHPRDEAFITPTSSSQPPGGRESDVLIHGSNSRNRAIHGDTVVVRLLPLSEWKSRSNTLPHSPTDSDNTQSPNDQRGHSQLETMATGVVVGILHRASREYAASFDEASDNRRGRSEKVLVLPYDIRIPKIRISTRQAEELRNHRIIVRIDSWEVGSQYPNGHFVRSIGPIGSIETETATILIEHCLSTSAFSKALLEELPDNLEGNPWKIDPDEVSRRRDLRHTHLVFSIDPQGCEDVDDTLSVRKLKHGVTELGVHIADVSYFVTPGSLTDREAQSRSTTIYLADRRYDMLPAVLSADLCSLLSNVDRYAVSVIWKLDSNNNYEVKDVWYGRSVIRSSYKLTYEVAEALYNHVSVEDIVEDIPELQREKLTTEGMEKMVEELRSAVCSLVDIARTLRERRSQGGALELEGVEVRVQLSDKEKTEIEDLIPKQPLEMHETVAECMIFANSWVAKRILKAFPSSSLLRHHPPPLREKFSTLRECAESQGFTVNTTSNKALAETLDKCVDPQDDSVNKILRMLATQAMTQAAYFSTGSVSPDQYGHYGLALEHYTHFTSPIRRYADLVVHRQLLTAVGQGEREVLPGNTQLEELTQHMNTKHRAAQLAQMASTELFQGLYFTNHSKSERCVVNGVVISLRANGIMVFVPRYGLRAPVYLRDKNGRVAQPDPTHSEDGLISAPGTVERDKAEIIVRYSSGQYCLRLFDHVKVRVVVEQSHAHGYSIGLLLLSNQPIHPESLKGYTPRKEVVRVVTNESEPRQPPIVDRGGVNKLYKQSEPSQSLYCLIQDLYRLSLQDNV